MLDLLLWLKDCGCSLDEIKASASNCVVAGQITKDDYKTITGDDYQATVAASTVPADTTSAVSDSTAATSGTANVTPTA